MAEEQHALSEADRKAINDIRRELDAEFGPLEETRPLDLREERDAPDADEPRTRAWSSRPGVVAAFVSGLLIGVLVGSLGMAWVLRQPPDDVPRTARTIPAPAPEPPVASLHEAATRRGEVLQEMRWERTAEGWVIVSERDARVLASD
jgi:hypothetical protein